MKPRTRLQHEVLELSKQLRYINNEILNWAKVKHLYHLAYATKHRFICMDCGGSSGASITNKKQVICPCCGNKLKVEVTNNRTLKQKNYVASAEIFGEFQVIRHFLIQSQHKAGSRAEYWITEVLQHWVKEDGKRECVGLNHTTNWYADAWNGNMEIRDKGQKKYWESNPRYEIYPDAYHPDSEFKACYMKYGINKELDGLTFLEAVKLLPEHPELETLLKAKQYSILAQCRSENWKARRYWQSIKIVMRNKRYKIKTYKEAGLWFDYLQLLSFFGKDLRNAHYVCPKNIEKAHDQYVAKKREYDKRRNEETKRRQAIENQEKFLQLKSKFFGLVFTDKDLVIKVLESVEEYLEEGDKMKHCVGSYFSKPNSLCFSARIDGQRIETVEVSLDTLKVIQSRGLQNKNTEYHDKIIKLVERNSKRIKERLNQTA